MAVRMSRKRHGFKDTAFTAIKSDTKFLTKYVKEEPLFCHQKVYERGIYLFIIYLFIDLYNVQGREQ